MNKLARTIAILATLTPVASVAQHPPTAVSGNGEPAYNPLTAADRVAICRNVAASYPNVHVMVSAPSVALDCAPYDRRVPFNVSYDSVTAMKGLAVHAGHVMPD
jgi:hypothetical protein